MNKVYTLVIEGDCPGVNANSDVYIQLDGIQHYSGKVVGVMFDDALVALEVCENKLEVCENKQDNKGIK